MCGRRRPAPSPGPTMSRTRVPSASACTAAPCVREPRVWMARSTTGGRVFPFRERLRGCRRLQVCAKERDRELLTAAAFLLAPSRARACAGARLCLDAGFTRLQRTLPSPLPGRELGRLRRRLVIQKTAFGPRRTSAFNDLSKDETATARTRVSILTARVTGVLPGSADPCRMAESRVAEDKSPAFSRESILSSCAQTAATSRTDTHGASRPRAGSRGSVVRLL